VKAAWRLVIEVFQQLFESAWPHVFLQELLYILRKQIHAFAACRLRRTDNVEGLREPLKSRVEKTQAQDDLVQDE
jgi:hypothetical protein